MDRTINYQITEEADGLRIEQFLRHQGYSYQNSTQLKKMPESILKNGVWEYMRSLPVSYTHLDVYKRQVFIFLKCFVYYSDHILQVFATI